MKFLVTGAAGFIGSHVSKRLLDEGYQVVGIDNLHNHYDDFNLKQARLNLIEGRNFSFYKLDLTDRENVEKLFSSEQFNRVIHLAAQVGVHFSLENPHAYVDTNLVGYLNVLENCRQNKVQHLLYASSSSVYGLNHKMPSSTKDSVDRPISFYAATKKANELMSHVYSHLYSLPTTGLRLFTVYGPWGRPDMALFKFTQAMIEGRTISIYNYGNMKRDFTYIDDVVEAIFRLQNTIPQNNQNLAFKTASTYSIISSAPYQIYNVGNNKPIKIIDCVNILEETLSIKAKKKLIPIQPCDVLETNADIKSLYQTIGFKPQTSIKDGIRRFYDWYKNFYNV